jgi:hypothetical protein
MGKKIKAAVNVDKVTYDDPRDAYLSTKSDMVVAKTGYAMDFFYGNEEQSKMVIAEDKKGYYLTCTSFIDANALDPYRQYKRYGKNNSVSITKTEQGFDLEMNGNIYSVNI